MNPLLRMLLRPLDVGREAGRADVLVVLGAALSRDMRSLGPALEERVVEGAAAFRRGLAPAMIVTGKLEASLMKVRAIELGVPAEAILLEHTALTTRENALFSAELMRRHGLERALIVTQPYHRLRAVTAFRRAGVEASALGFVSARTPPRQVFREYGALAVYGLRGWLHLY
jgi:uncharacterized SAM-binding protein YcdF (DUF218 family)